MKEKRLSRSHKKKRKLKRMKHRKYDQQKNRVKTISQNININFFETSWSNKSFFNIYLYLMIFYLIFFPSYFAFWVSFHSKTDV